MNMWAIVAVSGTVVAVGSLSLRVFLRSSVPKYQTAHLALVPEPNPLSKSAKKVTKVPQAAAEKPSVDIPENASSTRWVGALIDKRPDEAAAVLKRWIKGK
jgi:flagellar biosynthesis/type III secretory pathway M-ring protein FliF/YscJ